MYCARNKILFVGSMSTNFSYFPHPEMTISYTWSSICEFEKKPTCASIASSKGECDRFWRAKLLVINEIVSFSVSCGDVEASIGRNRCVLCWNKRGGARHCRWITEHRITNRFRIMYLVTFKASIFSTQKLQNSLVLQLNERILYLIHCTRI